MNMSSKNILRLLVNLVGLTLLALHCAEANAGYPTQTTSYQAPWVDGYTAYSVSGDSTTYYQCIGDSAGAAEGCSKSYWSSTNWGTFQDSGWQAVDTSSSTAPSDDPCAYAYAYLWDGTNCYADAFSWVASNGITHATRYTVVGQRCLYPAAPGYVMNACAANHLMRA